MRKRPLVLIACVFLTGLVYWRYAKWEMGVIGVLLIIRELWIGRQTGTFRIAAGRSVLLLSAFLLGIFHMWQEENFRAAYMSKLEDGNRITVWGELIRLESTEYGLRGILSDCYIDFGAGVMPCNEIMVYTSNDQYSLGQIRKISGKVNMFSKARNEGNFDAQVYYQSLKIDFAVEEIESILLQEKSSTIEGKLLSIKQSLGEVYQACLSKKAAGFCQAMVLGDKSKLDARLKELFLLGGIAHILAISGLHVSILGRGFYRVLRRGGIGFWASGLCGGILLLCYCFMVGSSISTVRAVGMMLLFFLAQAWGRSYDMLNALGGMVLFLLWENPFLVENSGFWFSVTALVGVGVVGQALCKKSEEKPKRVGTRKLWISLGITLATLPVTALSYYEIPVYSMLVNYVVLPLLTPVFGVAVVVGMLGISILPQVVTSFLLMPCEWLLAFYEGVCDMVSRLPCATVICGKPERWQIILYYIVLFTCVYIMEKQKEKKKSIVLVPMIIICGLCIFVPKEKPFEITFLDVGQGDGIYISAGDGTTYFIDGGSTSVNQVGESRILPFLKAKGVSSIQYWFVSHCDTDHTSGLYELIEKGYKIEHIVLYEQSSVNKKYQSLLQIAKNSGIKVVYMQAGDRVYSESMEIICLAPVTESNDVVSDDANENSLVLKVTWNAKQSSEEFTALFAGDISTETENVLCESGMLQHVDLVKANHHGSNYSNGENWFAVIQPEYIVVSCGANNLYGHPGSEAVERMEACEARIFYTMENGQITFPLIQ